ncbi:hypothetical protein GCM10027167_73330 [Nocardia heshunensis]
MGSSPTLGTKQEGRPGVHRGGPLLIGHAAGPTAPPPPSAAASTWSGDRVTDERRCRIALNSLHDLDIRPDAALQPSGAEHLGRVGGGESELSYELVGVVEVADE